MHPTSLTSKLKPKPLALTQSVALSKFGVKGLKTWYISILGFYFSDPKKNY